MGRSRYCLAVIVCLGLLPARVVGDDPAPGGRAPPGKERPVRTDRNGHWLPEHALARLGTLRLRYPGKVGAVLFSPDGQTVFAGGARTADGGSVAFIRSWDVRTRRPRCEFTGEGNWAGGLALSPDGALLACPGHRVGVQLWHARTGQTAGVLDANDGAIGFVASVTFSPDSRTLAATGMHRVLELWDVATRKRRSRRNRGLAWGVVYAPPGGAALAAWERGALSLRDGVTAAQLWQAALTPGGEHSLAFSPDGKLLAAGSGDGAVHVFAVATGKERCRTGNRDKVEAAAFSPAGTRLASAGKDGTVRLWDAATGKEIRGLEGHPGLVGALAFSPDGRTLASGGGDGLVLLWDPATGKERAPPVGRAGPVFAVAYAPDGKALASAAAFDHVRLWDPGTGRQVRTLPRLDGAGVLAYSPDGTRLAVGDGTGPILVYDPQTGKERLRLRGHAGPVVALAFTSDGKRLASAGFDETVRLWDVAAGKELRRLEAWSGWQWVTSLAFAADGKTLAAGGDDGTIHLADTRTGKEIRRLAAHQDRVRAVAYVPDRAMLLSASDDGTLGLWDAASGKGLRRLARHEGAVLSAAVSPDGRLVASGGHDGTVRVWEVASGQEVLCCRGHDGAVDSVAFAADGQTLISGGEDGTVLVWDATGLRGTPQPELARPELERLCKELSETDARVAYRAARRLAAARNRAVAPLAARVPPVRRVSAERIERLITELGDRRFATRQQATDALIALAEVAEPALAKALRNPADEEVRRRLVRIRAAMEPDAPTRLRGLRAVAVLEYIGTPEARAVLAALAKGDVAAALTREAKAALERLDKQKGIAHRP